MFMGEYHHNIDDKGRLIIPVKFREELGYKFVVTRGLDGCLFLYPINEWTQIIEKLKKLSFTKKDARSFMRFFLSGAADCELDKQGRINITSPLASYANLMRECIIIGVNERIEIWAKDSYESYFKDNEANVAEIAENLFETDLNI